MSNFVTKDELKEYLSILNENTKSYIDSVAQSINENVTKAISQSFQYLSDEQKRLRKESDERMMAFEKVQTDRLLKALERYEKLT